MAIPLTPETGMFPGTEVEPFIAAPDLEALVDEVIAAYDEFDPIAIARREEGLSIACVFETKPFDPLEEELKPHTIAKVTKASPLWRCLTDREYVIQFRKAFWDAFDERQRTAVVHHELTHIDITVDAKGRTKYGTREHDVEDFTQTMRRFGPILPSRSAFVKAFLDWQHEQDRPGPTVLHPVATKAEQRAADKIAGDAVDDAEQAFRDDEGGPA
jgi:Putative phage metallopeptidase